MSNSNSYIRLGLTVEELKQAMAIHKNSIQKADIHDIGTIHGCMAAHEEVNLLSKSVHTEFTALKNDFKSGNIPLTRYKRDLEVLKSLLLDSGEKLTNPNLKAEEIAVEIIRYC